MEMKHLLSYTAVVRLNSFSRAAKELFISQPTISLHIRQLEEELHTTLLMRTTKTIELTEKGREVYEYAAGILQLRARMIDCCESGSRHIIHLGASTIPSAYILPELLPSYVNHHPDTYFIIDQGDSGEIVQKLEDGLIDIGLIGMNVNSDQLISEPFFEDSVVIITPVNEHFLALSEQPAPDIHELLKEPIILREEGSGSRKAADLFLADLGIAEKDLTISARINDPEAIKNLVAGGLGISIISEKAAENYRRENRLLTFSLSPSGRTRSLCLVHRRHPALPVYADTFLRYVKQFYAGSFS